MNPLFGLLWLLVIIVGLPQISETVYTPALPAIAHALAVSEAWVEYTLTIYLLAFAFGTLFWGRLSDTFGRRPCLLFGLVFYVIGCIGCFYSGNILFLLLSRFIQGFGGSVGSVLGQAICRDAFHGAERGKVYSTIGSVLAFSPALGPVVGGAIVDSGYGWSAIFLFLILAGLGTLLASYVKLPETYAVHARKEVLIGAIIWRMCCDIRVLAFGMLVAGCNGIVFSYYAEGPFFLIRTIGLSPSTYGMSFACISLAGMLGGYLSRRLHEAYTSLQILGQGIWVVIGGAVIFSGTIFAVSGLSASHSSLVIAATLGCMMIIMTGTAMIIPNALSLALEDYRDAIGTASSLFGFFYYVVISAFTFGMGLLHTGTLLPMPLYFLGISVLMAAIFSLVLGERKQIL